MGRTIAQKPKVTENYVILYDKTKLLYLTNNTGSIEQSRAIYRRVV